MLAIDFGAKTVHAQTLCKDGKGFVPRPAPQAITSNMGPRNTGIPGASKVHRGTDYATKCQKIGGPPKGCIKTGKTKASGYGNILQFDCGNGIRLQYAHLASSNYNAASNVISTGNTGVGACHLDYIMTIDGKVVDSQCATGNVTGQYTYGKSSVKHGKKCPFSGPVNLCDSNVKNELKKHAQSILQGTGKENYNIADGPTSPSPPSTGDNHDDAGHNHQETGPGTVINQGTEGKDGTGGVTGGDKPPIDEPQPDPEEEEPTPPKPGDKYDPKASTPICDNSTCITQDTIDNAKHKRVKYDKADPHWDYLKPDGKCKDPIKTGATVFRQHKGEIKDYPDSFCTNQGCTYINEGSSGDGKCE